MARQRRIDGAPGPMARLATGLGALTVLVGITAGLPLALRYAAAVMLPHGWTPLAELPGALTSPDDGTLFAQAIIAAGWGVWAIFSLLVLWEIMRRLLGRQPHTTARVRTPHGLAGLLVAAVAALTTSPTAASSVQAATVAVVATDSPLPDDDQMPPEPATGPRYITHLVDRGEGLLDVAEKYHLSWEQVAEANYGRPQPDGGMLEPGRTVIYPGWQLRIPATPAPATTLVAAAEDSPTVCAGEHILNINGDRWAYQVQRDDSLWHIAELCLGDGTRWPDIWELNRGRHFPQVGGTLHDPDLIYPGWDLELPSDAVPPPEAEPVQPEAPEPPADPEPEPEPEPAPPASVTPAPSQRPEPTPPAASTPAPGVTGPGERPDAGQPDEPFTEDEPSDTGVVLPTGAWVSFGLAAVIASAALLLRAHRRRRARLRTRPIPTSLAPAEPPPLPESLRPVEDAGLRVLEPDDDPATPGLLPVPATPAAVGVNGASEQVSLFDLPGGLITVYGDGAASAVRAILAAALGTGVTEHTGVQPRVVIPVGMLAQLLPEGTPAVGLDLDGDTFDEERLEVVADEAAALTRWEEEMFHRRRMCDQHDAATVGELVARDEHPEHLPPFVLFVPAASRYLPRLRAVAVHRQALLLHTVLLGEPGGELPGWRVDPDGTTTGEVPHEADEPADSYGLVPPVVRLSTLGAQELAAVLEVIRQVAPRTEPGHDDTEPAAPAESAASAELEPVAETPAVPIPSPSGDDPPPVKLRVLGVPQLSTDGGPLTEGVRTGSVAVMTLLAAHPGGLGLDEIAATLHPGVERPLARGRVHTDIDAARSLLRKITGAAEGARFVLYDSKTRRYTLDADLVEVDLWQMLTQVETANRAGDDPAALAALRQAIELYSGDFASGFEQAWAVEHATTIRHTITQASARIAEILEVDDPGEAVAALESAISLEPVNEELYRRLMRIHGRTGNPDRVRATFKLLERRLADLGDSEPSQATRRVADRQLSGPPNRHTPAAAPGGSSTTQAADGTGHDTRREPVVNR